MDIFLIILKIIGIILLCIVGLVLFLILLLFIAPVRYRMRGEKGEQLTFEGKAWWLFHLLTLDYKTGSDGAAETPEEGGTLEIRLFGKNLIRNQEKDDEEDHEPAGTDDPESYPEENEENRKKDSEGSGTPDREPDTEDDLEAGEGDSGSAGGSNDSDGPSGRLKRFKRIKKLISDDITKKALSFAYHKLLALLRHISPKKATGRIRFGFDSPAHTGIALGAAAAFLPAHRNAVALEPDFTEECFEGNLACEGSINVGYAAVLFLEVYYNRDIRKTLKRYKTLQKLNGETSYEKSSLNL